MKSVLTTIGIVGHWEFWEILGFRTLASTPRTPRPRSSGPTDKRTRGAERRRAEWQREGKKGAREKARGSKAGRKGWSCRTMGRKKQRKNRLRGEGREDGARREAESTARAGSESAVLLRTPGRGQHPTLPVSEADPRGCTPDGGSGRGRRGLDVQLRRGPAQF